MNFLRFPELSVRGLSHAFTLRSDPPLMLGDVPEILQEAGLPENYVMGEQTHGSGVAVVSKWETGRVIPSVDGLVTEERGLALVVRVADCGPIWIHCEKTGAIGLVHSGRKGTELGVVRVAIRTMREKFGCDSEKMVAVLGPCIRPPHYDVPFADEIVRQLRAEGVGEIVDTKLCTASDPQKFYSYRAEKGKTGRHFAMLSG